MTPPEEEDRLETVLRRALEREAGQVSPSQDGLRRIRETIALEDSRRRLGRQARGQRWRPLLVAASAAGLIAAGIGAQPLLRTIQGDTAASTSGSSPTARAPGAPGPITTTTPPALPPATPSSTAASTAAGPSRPATAAALPVYVVGQQGQTYGLFREFRRTSQSEPAARVQEAVAAALGDRPDNPTYLRVWAARSAARTTVTDSVIVVDLNQAAAATNRVSDLGEVPGEVLIQQLVWTATAALASADAAAAGSAGLPVRITVSGGTVNVFGVDLAQPLTRQSLGDPRAGVWITSPATGATVEAGMLRITGEAVSRPENPPAWSLTPADGTARTGTLQLTARPDGSGGAPRVGGRGYFTLSLDLDAAGDYVFRVQLEDPTTPVAGTAWSDRVDFTVSAG